MSKIWNRSVLTACLLTLVSQFISLESASAQGIPDGYSVSSLTRATILVRDLEESLKLYRDILGLTVRPRPPLKGPVSIWGRKATV